MFVHLHCHFKGSFSDSALPLERTVKKAKECGHNAIAITDHGELSFVPEFQRKCRENGIKPIIGVEVYFVPDAKQCIKKKDNERYHLIFIAKNENGYKNLVRLVSKSWIENNFYGRRGLVDYKLLREHHKDLLCLTACFFNPISQIYFKNGISKGEDEFLKLREIFGDDLFLEVGRHFIKEEEESNEFLIKLSKKYNVPIILTNDVHYLEKEDWIKHDLIIKSRFGRITDFHVDSRDYWYKTTDEMKELGFPEEFLKNTLIVSDKCKEYDLPNEGDYDWVDFDVFPVEFEEIDEKEAEWVSNEVLGNIEKEIVEGIVKFWRRAKVIPERIIKCKEKILGEVVPLRITERVFTVQYLLSDLKNFGCSLSDDLNFLKNPDTLMWLGWALFRRNNFDKAERFFLNSISNGSDNPLNFYGIGIIKWKKEGNLKEAKEYFVKYLKMDSSSKRSKKVRKILDIISK